MSHADTAETVRILEQLRDGHEKQLLQNQHYIALRTLNAALAEISYLRVGPEAHHAQDAAGGEPSDYWRFSCVAAEPKPAEPAPTDSQPQLAVTTTPLASNPAGASGGTWGPDEETSLRELPPGRTYAWYADTIKRSESAVIQKAKKLGCFDKARVQPAAKKSPDAKPDSSPEAPSPKRARGAAVTTHLRPTAQPPGLPDVLTGGVFASDPAHGRSAFDRRVALDRLDISAVLADAGHVAQRVTDTLYALNDRHVPLRKVLELYNEVLAKKGLQPVVVDDYA